MKQSVSPPASLTPLYDRWLSELLPASIPGERHATCDDCAMCARPGEDAADGHFFDPRSKCCTYSPSLANYLVGGILRDPEALARSAVEQRMADRVAVTPLMIMAPPRDLLIYGNLEIGAFGRSVSLTCSYYQPDSGRCGVWRHRNSVCATWFCKHVRGATGLAFWTSLTGLLMRIEDSLSKWLALELGMDPAVLLELPGIAEAKGGRLDPGMLDGHVEPAEYRRTWGTWVGREAEFYGRCAEIAGELGWSDVLRVGGADVRLRAEAARAAFDALTSDALPAAVGVAPFAVVRIGLDKVVVNTYRAIDPISVPRRLFERLHQFEGRTPQQAIEELRQDGLPIQPSLVRKLVDFRVLTAKELAPPASPDGAAQ